MKNRKLLVALMFVALALFTAPAMAANLLVTWTLPTADIDGNVYTPADKAAMETVLYTGTSSPPSTANGGGQPPGAVSRVIVASGTVGTTTYIGAKTTVGADTSALSNVLAYVWVLAPPAPPTLVSVTRQ